MDGRLLIDDAIDHIVTPEEGYVYVADAIRTPVATPPAGVSIPEPGECQVEPRSDAGLRRILSATPDANPAPFDRSRPGALPTGTPADAETVRGVEATVRQFVACRNAGDRRRELALGTDAYILDVRAMNPGMADVALAGTPEALPASRPVWVEDIRDVVVLADGRIAAIVIDQVVEYLVTPAGEIVWVAEALATPDVPATPVP